MTESDQARTREPSDIKHRGRALDISASLAADRRWLVGLALATYAVYFRVITFGFVFDDRPLILNNPLLLSWYSIPRFFTEHLVAFLHPHSQGSYYRPVLSLWLLLNRHAWGLRPWGWHLSTLSLHVLASLAVCVLARRIIGSRFGAGIAAMVFALHPAHVESVAWIMGLPDPLMTLLAVSAFLAFLRGREGRASQRRTWQIISSVIYGLAILTKEVALALPLLILAYEWILDPASPGADRSAKMADRFLKSITPVLPFFAVTVVYLAARWRALGGLSHALTPIAWKTLVATWPLVLWLHLKILLWPVGLSAFYDVPYVTRPGLVNCALPLAMLLVCALLMLWISLRSPQAGFAAIWLFLPMLLLLNLRIFPEGEIVHDRFMYFPSVGLALLMGLGAEKLVSLRRPAGSPDPHPGPPPGPRERWKSGLGISPATCRWALALMLGAALGGAAFYYCGFWANDWTLYGRALSVAPGNKLAANNLASDLADAGRYSEAIAIYQRILKRDPNYGLATYNLGYCLYRTGRFAESTAYLEHAITLNAAEPEPYIYLGLADFQTGRMTEAIANLVQGVALSPDNPRYRFSLGVVLRARGDRGAARREFSTALSLDPHLTAAREQIAEMDR